MDDALRAILDSIQESTEYLGIEVDDVNQRGHFGNTPLKVAVVRGDLDAVHALLDAGADVNAVVEDGFVALHHAAAQGHVEIVALLLERGANAAVLNDDGRTPLDLARVLGEHEAARALKTHRDNEK